MQPGEDQLKSWMTEGLGGNAASHAILLRALVPLLRAFYRRRVADGDVIEDLVQETLIAVHTRRMTYDPERPFTAWLFAVARYKMIDHFRRTRQTCSIEDAEDMLFSEGFEDAVSASIDIERLLATLPEKQAKAIRQTRIAGQSTAEAASLTDISESDVKVSVHRGLKALAARIRGARP
ncbi:sigma-70 family RNA polymerase sigma factor [Novosphingobium sp. G106]|uniref:sigma-70 family RNA polymerase sigma factor n=1 Tax=Novosphingobium sp. G106 TaxID=2849500 RepID=UPI001C2CF3BB|nr:sigma-70 family RNA polymerase sigma factor [Novosphingobium sp. G106]MBV1686778.1 sigma-70 family RNA polymerase sigma factor [Novosphingobium sp. G106]